MSDTEREAFETWHKREFAAFNYPYETDADGDYTVGGVQADWVAFQAARALSEQDRRDAERYRWLRAHKFDCVGTDDNQEFDAAIDAARGDG